MMRRNRHISQSEELSHGLYIHTANTLDVQHMMLTRLDDFSTRATEELDKSGFVGPLDVVLSRDFDIEVVRGGLKHWSDYFRQGIDDERAFYASIQSQRAMASRALIDTLAMADMLNHQAYRTIKARLNNQAS